MCVCVCVCVCVCLGAAKCESNPPQFLRCAFMCVYVCVCINHTFRSICSHSHTVGTHVRPKSELTVSLRLQTLFAVEINKDLDKLKAAVTVKVKVHDPNRNTWASPAHLLHGQSGLLSKILFLNTFLGYVAFLFYSELYFNCSKIIWWNMVNCYRVNYLIPVVKIGGVKYINALIFSLLKKFLHRLPVTKSHHIESIVTPPVQRVSVYLTIYNIERRFMYNRTTALIQSAYYILIS